MSEFKIGDKEKVKYYPPLIFSNNHFLIRQMSNEYFKNEQDAIIFYKNKKFDIFIRLITEIPELIKEKDE